MRHVVVWTLIASLIGCASTTRIVTDPVGVKVYVNDEYVGRSPADYTDSRMIGAQSRVRLEKEGYQTLETYFTRDEKVDWPMLALAVYFIIPVLWVMDYKSEHRYELKPMIPYVEPDDPDDLGS